jgi:hypothetical protein
VEHISVASLKPTDVVIVNVSEYISMSTADRMRALLKEIWPDNKVLVLEKGVEIKIADGRGEVTSPMRIHQSTRILRRAVRHAAGTTVSATAQAHAAPDLTQLAEMRRACEDLRAPLEKPINVTIVLDGRKVAEHTVHMLPKMLMDQGLR